MFSQLELAKHRAKFQHAVASPAEQARQLAALQSVIMGLLGLGCYILWNGTKVFLSSKSFF